MLDAIFVVDGVVQTRRMNALEAEEGEILVPADTVFTGFLENPDGSFRPPHAPPVEPAPPGSLPSISDRQFFQALASSPWSLITTTEALDAVKTGEIPPAMQAFIAAMPAADQFAATMVIAGATEFKRDHPLVNAFAQAQGLTAVQIDDLWRFAAGL